MHLLYAVEFDVTAEGDASPFAAIQMQIAEWLSGGSSASVSVGDIETSGAVALPAVKIPGRTFTDRTATWEVQSSTDARALRVSVVQPLPSGVELTTRVTVSEADGRVQLRVGLSREYLGGALVPVGDTSILQPGVVRNIAHNPDVTLFIGSQRIDPRFQPVHGSEGVASLLAALRSPSRLPLLLVHTRTLQARDAAFMAAQKLIGLVRVVTIGNAERVAVARELPNAAVPFGGARLVWSDVDAPGISVAAADIVAGDREHLRTVLMPRLAPVAALVRGIDEGWRRARQRVQEVARVEASERVRLAQDEADVNEERDALRAKVSLLEEELVSAEELLNEAADKANDLQQAASSAEDLRVQMEYWKTLYHGQFGESAGSTPAANDDPWADIPVLTSKVSPKNTFLALTDASDGRIVFTDAAERSWRKIDYPDPEDMTAALTALARGAQKLYSDDPGTIGRLGDWFKLHFDIKVATSDKTIEDDDSLRYFEFEDLRWDQVRHVKVRDGVKPNEVGRIHFARDSDGGRLIVNHVALKLYGI